MTLPGSNCILFEKRSQIELKSSQIELLDLQWTNLIDDFRYLSLMLGVLPLFKQSFYRMNFLSCMTIVTVAMNIVPVSSEYHNVHTSKSR